MATVPKKRSLADMQQGRRSTPDELNDGDYLSEVLQLESSGTENALDDGLAHDAAVLGIEIPPPISVKHNGHESVCDSSVTIGSRHARTGSSGSQASISTGITSRSSTENIDGSSPVPSKRSHSRRSLSFSDYDKFILQQQQPGTGLTMYPMPPIPSDPAPSLFSVSTRKSYNSIKNGIKVRLKLRRNKASEENLNSCICCRDDFKRNNSLHSLPCLHKYCDKCLRVLIQQASCDESKMPPRCCSRAVPGSVVQSVLTPEEQYNFMESVVQFSTPWEERIFCPNKACGEFIPKPRKIDPKHPFEVVCRKCTTKACSICKHDAHMTGQDCPADWELDAVLKMGENQGWRRCYKCRTLVELMQGCSHITCRCKAQFCYICGAVWDPTVGCPNYCNGEIELERRRIEDEARAASEAAERAAKEAEDSANAADTIEAINRTNTSEDINAIRARQINERDRFIIFERKMKWLMWTRHGQMKLDILDKYGDIQVKMRERHTRTATHLEDRQVAAEMELRSNLKQSERSVQIRLRHMEAYCDGLGRNAGPNPARVVTERDLRELGQQYNIRDDLDRLHQSRINVMREKQSKQMEQLLNRQEDEVEKLAIKQNEELDAIEDAFGLEEEQFIEAFAQRKERLRRRWKIATDVTRKRLEVKTGLRYGPVAEINWPEHERKEDVGLEVVTE